MGDDELLIVEDDDDLREELVELLGMLGHTAVPARNGREAMALLGAGHRPVLILLDLSMPVMSGYEVLDRVNADPELRELPVAIMSAMGVPPDELPVPHRSAGYIQKPFEVPRLLELVGRYRASPPA
jgi:CheY-like chemotaxis protein